jgi:hypothetical protein
MAAPAERLQPADDALLERIEGRDQRCCDRRQHDQQHDRRKNQGNRIMAQPIEHRLPVPAHPCRRQRLVLKCVQRLVEDDGVGHLGCLFPVQNDLARSGR